MPQLRLTTFFCLLAAGATTTSASSVHLVRGISSRVVKQSESNPLLDNCARCTSVCVCVCVCVRAFCCDAFRYLSRERRLCAHEKGIRRPTFCWVASCCLRMRLRHSGTGGRSTRPHHLVKTLRRSITVRSSRHTDHLTRWGCRRQGTVIPLGGPRCGDRTLGSWEWDGEGQRYLPRTWRGGIMHCWRRFHQAVEESYQPQPWRTCRSGVYCRMDGTREPSDMVQGSRRTIHAPL